jgi:hypothetical protein
MITSTTTTTSTTHIPLTSKVHRSFSNAIGPSKTKTLYNLALSKFVTLSYVDNVDSPISTYSKLTTARIIEFVVCEKEKGTSFGSLCAYLTAIKMFYDLNDVVLLWKKINICICQRKRRFIMTVLIDMRR